MVTGVQTCALPISRRFHVAPGQMLAANGLDPDAQTLAQACRLLVPGAPGN